MKRTLFVLFVLLIASCSRRMLNNQSARDSGYQQDNKPAPVTQSPPANNTNYDPGTSNGNNPSPQNNYDASGNYNNQAPPQVNYGAPSYQTFYDELSPYGYWVNYSNYGYVWVPNAGSNFSPYCSNGHWVYTDYGWTWASDYSWGWAPFHYGRWFADPMYGWMWVPGNEWAPAWVTWGQYNGYYGWAPLGPGNTWGYVPPQQNWYFVPERHVTQVNVNNYIETRTTVVNVNNVTVINNNTNAGGTHTYYSGPKLNEIETATGTKITPLKVNETAKPVTKAEGGNNFNIYRPAINAGSATKAAPAKIVPVEKVPAPNKRVLPVQTPNNQPGQKPTEKIVEHPGAAPLQPVSPKPAEKPMQPVNERTVEPKRPPQEPVKPVQEPVNPITPPQQPRQDPARPTQQQAPNPITVKPNNQPANNNRSQQQRPQQPPPKKAAPAAKPEERKKQ